MAAAGDGAGGRGVATTAGEEGLQAACGITLWGAALLGLVEGLTEFLPVSSTGHLILVHHLLGGQHSLFEVAIQGGAITAILVLYRQRVAEAFRRLPAAARGEGGPNLLLLLLVAALPAAGLGLLLEDWIETELFRPWVVAAAMVGGGVLLLLLELWHGRSDAGDAPLERIGYRHALWIGLFQCLALVPGTSRAAATMAGAMLLGYARTAAAEFSFLLGLPILYGACGLKLWRHWPEASGPLWPGLLLATGLAFVSALLVVRPFVHFLRHHTFVPFAIYRILAGLAVFALVAGGTF